MDGPIASVEQGKLRGTVLKDYKGNEFLSFKGIPYAKPPIDELRFKAPLPATPWPGIRDATKEGDPCYQVDMLRQMTVGSEDCLYLNVYTKELLTDHQEKMKPVMVYIHGGAFVSGSASSEYLGPEYLMTEDIVLVTINYRLGILGFLSFDDPNLEVPGNMGMKDMVMALKWVKENICYFCGDPINVTIFGHSAGSAAVHYLVLSPMAKGLFQKAILQSGSAFNTWAIGEFINNDVMEKWGFEDADPHRVLHTLRGIALEDLYSYQLKLADCMDPNNCRYLAPVIENTNLEQPFLPKSPLEIIMSGDYNHVPMIFGYTASEGMLAEILKSIPNSLIWKKIEASIPHYLKYHENSKETELLVDKIKKFYLKNQEVFETEPDNLYTLTTDTMFLTGILGAINQHLRNAKYPIYLYRMTVESSLNFVKSMFNFKSPGACHGDDIGYLFKTMVSPAEVEVDSLEDVSIQRFVKLLTNFARCGNPTPQGDGGVLGINWSPVARNAINYLNIGETLDMNVDPEPDRMQFWREILKMNSTYANFL